MSRLVIVFSVVTEFLKRFIRTFLNNVCVYDFNFYVMYIRESLIAILTLARGV